MPTATLTPFGQFRQRWKDCRKCPLWETRKNLVLAKGSVPCDILFVGEAPGASEDVVGIPFIGPAGKLLDQLTARAIPATMQPKPRIAYTNLVCCFPQGEDGAKATEPEAADIMECQPRLEQFIILCSPRLVVCVGQLPAKWLDPKATGSLAGTRIRVLAIAHPAFILRSTIANQGLMKQRCVVQLQDAIEEVMKEGYRHASN